MTPDGTRLHHPTWRAGALLIALLGATVAVIAAMRWGSDGPVVVDAFFVLLGAAIVAVSLWVGLSSVVLRPGEVEVRNGLRRRRIPNGAIRDVSIAGYGDQRGAMPGEPPPRATWVLRIDTTSGPVFALGLASNRRPSSRERLRLLVADVTAHCGLGEPPP